MTREPTWSRRSILRGSAAVGAVAAAGCLRLTGDSTETPTDAQGGTGAGGQGGSTTGSTGSTDSPGGSTTAGSASGVDLVPAWSGAGSAVTAADGDFFVRPRFTRLSRVRTDGTTVFDTDIADGYLASISPTFRNALHADETGVYVGAGAGDEVDTGGRVYALDPETGDERWMYEEPGDGLHDSIRAVTVDDGTVIYASQSSGSGDEQEPIVRGVDAESGDERWRIRLPEGFVNGIVAHGDRLFAAQTFELHIYRRSTRDELETRRLSTGFSRPVRRGDTLFAPGETVRALALPDAEERWAVETGREVNTTPGIGEAGVFVGTESGFVLGYDRDTGDQLWEARVPGVVEHPPIVEDGLVWIATERGDLLAFTAATGELRYEEAIGSDFEFTIQDGILNDDERDTTYEVRRD